MYNQALTLDLIHLSYTFVTPCKLIVILYSNFSAQMEFSVDHRQSSMETF